MHRLRAGLTGKDNVRALPGRVFRDLLANKEAEVCAKPGHERCPRSDTVGVKCIFWNDFPLAFCFGFGLQAGSNIDQCLKPVP